MAMEAPPYPIVEEKPDHYRYLKNFRTAPCKLFPVHRCDKAKPFTCFDWHYQNQKRRVPKRDTKDGNFNYSATEYCPVYDPEKGTCTNGDKCRLLHKASGEVEKLYHLRFYKTEQCQHPLDAKGHCTRNGPHCAFAHGDADVRLPVYDAAELRAMQNDQAAAPAAATASRVPAAAAGVGPNAALSASRAAATSGGPRAGVQPDWTLPATVLERYKIEICPQPPRLCQGQSCPKYHSPLDRRRNPYSFVYRPQPCSDVKVADKWSEPSKCPRGDNCMFSHTRNEQQFHPEVYKSVICGDYASGLAVGRPCRRGLYCAFAHGDEDRASVDRSRGLPATVQQPQPTFSVQQPQTTFSVQQPQTTFSVPSQQPLSGLPPPPGLKAPGQPVAAAATMLSTAPQPTAAFGTPLTSFAATAAAAKATEPVVAATRSLPAAAAAKSSHDLLPHPAPAKPPRAGASVDAVSTAGGLVPSAADALATVEELFRLIDADTTIDILEKKRRKKLVQDVAGASRTLTFDLYSDVISDAPGLTDGYAGLGATGSGLLQQFEGLVLSSSGVTGYAQSDFAMSDIILNRHNGDRSEVPVEDKVLQMLLEAKSLLNPAKLNDLSPKELRAIRKQLQQQMDIVEEAIQEKIDRQS